MELSASELCRLLQGKLEGDPDVRVSRPAKIEEGLAGDVCFLSNEKYLKFAYTTQASVLIIDDNLVLDGPVIPTLIRVPNAYAAFSSVLQAYQKQQQVQQTEGVHPTAYIEENVRIGKGVQVGPLCHISTGVRLGDGVILTSGVFVGRNAQIGDGSVLHAGVKVLHDCQVGAHCTLHAGVVVGSDGFGFAPQADGSYTKVPQTGIVWIGDGVEIGANTTIDRATMGATKIGHGVKLDNLIQIAHNVEIGDHTVIAAQAGISGSTKIGRYCLIGGQAGIVGHIQIADKTRINAQSGVAKAIKTEGTVITGSPAFDYGEAMKAQVIFKQLPDLAKKLRELEHKLKALEEGK